ncbi:MAG: enoyl-CoA hydratase/isomerase family protein [Candidatus Melainabacteria bacterium]|nr:enoyl-CoA hydratase/isomerase family protein [Candidatus Melainabacteria bacterium]
MSITEIEKNNNHKGFFQSIPAEKFAFKEIHYQKKDYIATITLNRPFNLNAYSTSALKELCDAFEDASFDDAVGVIVYTGAGDRAFCTGGDVKEYEEIYTARPRDYWKYMGLFSRYLESIMNAGKPVIARLNGIAVGGGNESQLACDLSVMAEHAYLGQVGTNVGSVACGGATQWLPLTVGDRRAHEMLLLNGRIQARQALEWGLVNRVAPSVTKDGKFIENPSKDQIDKALKKTDGFEINLSKLDEEVAALCQTLLEKFPECSRYTKQHVNFLKSFTWYQTIGHARDWLSTHYTSLEPLEGMRAFVEKRKPDYMGLRERARMGRSSEFMHGAYKRDCQHCSATGIPEDFDYCGKCGKPF